MGWRGTMRSIGAAMRAAERDAQRQRRARERYLAAMDKVRELEQAAQAVADYDTYVAQLISIHKEGKHPSSHRVDGERQLG